MSVSPILMSRIADPQRLAKLIQLALLDSPTEQSFDRLTWLAAHILRVPAALVSLIDRDHQFIKSCAGLNETWATTRQMPLSHSFCQYVVATGEPLIVRDAREHPMTRENPAIRDFNIIAYLGFPLCTPDGYVLGSFCVIDHHPRDWTDEQIKMLQELTVSVITELDLRAEIGVRQQTEYALHRLKESLEQRVDERTTAVTQANQQLREAYDATLAGWARLLELRDKDTEGHTQRVTDMTVRVAAAFGYQDEGLEQIRRGALLHDMGKMGIPDQILHKQEALTNQEWATMRQHPGLAYHVLKPIAFLAPALTIPYCHHERWDGTGYPQRLRGEDIPLPARIFAVVDVWDALRFDRPYREGWPSAKVLDYIRSERGTHFDPCVVDLFLRIIEEEGEPTLEQPRKICVSV